MILMNIPVKSTIEYQECVVARPGVQSMKWEQRCGCSYPDSVGVLFKAASLHLLFLASVHKSLDANVFTVHLFSSLGAFILKE